MNIVINLVSDSFPFPHLSGTRPFTNHSQTGHKRCRLASVESRGIGGHYEIVQGKVCSSWWIKKHPRDRKMKKQSRYLPSLVE